MAVGPRVNCSVEVALKDFIQLLKAYKVGKKLGKRNKLREEAAFSFKAGQLTVNAVGANQSIPASGSWSGFARIAFLHFDAYRRVPPTQDPLQISYLDGRLKIGTASIPAEWSRSLI